MPVMVSYSWLPAAMNNCLSNKKKKKRLVISQQLALSFFVVLFSLSKGKATLRVMDIIHVIWFERIHSSPEHVLLLCWTR